jgi:hypothetical protein
VLSRLQRFDWLAAGRVAFRVGCLLLALALTVVLVAFGPLLFAISVAEPKATRKVFWLGLLAGLVMVIRKLLRSAFHPAIA